MTEKDAARPDPKDKDAFVRWAERNKAKATIAVSKVC